jgi:hypothetical protein
VEFRAYRGTERASLSSATEGCLLLAAALEAILLAGLALEVSRAGRGSVITELFLRLNDLLVRPLGLLPPLAGQLSQQIAAILLYGALLMALTATVAWFDRRQSLGY